MLLKHCLWVICLFYILHKNEFCVPPQVFHYEYRLFQIRLSIPDLKLEKPKMLQNLELSSIDMMLCWQSLASCNRSHSKLGHTKNTLQGREMVLWVECCHISLRTWGWSWEPCRSLLSVVACLSAQHKRGRDREFLKQAGLPGYPKWWAPGTARRPASVYKVMSNQNIQCQPQASTIEHTCTYLHTCGHSHTEACVYIVHAQICKHMHVYYGYAYDKKYCIKSHSSQNITYKGNNRVVCLDLGPFPQISYYLYTNSPKSKKNLHPKH